MKFGAPLWFFIGLLAAVPNATQAQTVVRGQITGAMHQPIQLYGFSQLGIKPLDSTFSTYEGRFEVRTPSDYKGVALLVQNQQFAIAVLVQDSVVELSGTTLERETGVQALKGEHQIAWSRYIGAREALDVADARWADVGKWYAQHPQLPRAAKVQSAANKERLALLKAQATAEAEWVKLPFLQWYVQTRDIVLGTKPLPPGGDDAQRRYEALATLNMADPRWETSGLLRDRIDAPFKLAKSLGMLEMDAQERAKADIEAWIPGLSTQPTLFEPVLTYLFEQLEAQGNMGLAEFAAEKSLLTNCSLSSATQRRLKALRTFKPGAQMPNLPLEGTVLLNDPDRRSGIPNRLSDLGGRRTLVVFGASWCGHCQQELPLLAQRVESWKKKGIAVVLISLDDNPDDFKKLANQLPVTAVCDFKKWDSPAADLFNIYATPSYFLIDSNGKLLSRDANLQTLQNYIDLSAP
jgi:thiol-disulfide isomerase/thioredoxin